MNKKRETVGFVALGCPKNMVDSERMLALIAEAGLAITQDCDNADVVVINTCGFIEPARAEAMEAINHAIERKNKGKVRKVIVAGCLSQRLGKNLLNEAPGIDTVVGLENRDNIAQIIKKTITSQIPVSAVTAVSRILYDDRTRLRITPAHWAYLRIGEGCSKKCSFCTIPSIRGKTRSKPLPLIISEAKELVASGAVELNIIAQDITAYGRDLARKIYLPQLLEKLAAIPRLNWIRLLYLYPSGIDERLIETIARSEKIVHYFDIPLQHVNSQILKAMRRPHSKDAIRRLIENLRTRLPDCVLRTTLIAGFPGETDARFRELLDFVKWARFDNLGCFTFYPETGTAAAKLPRQVPERVKQQRFDEIMLTQQKIAFDKNKTMRGALLTCLIDKAEKGSFATGRFFGQAPDIDPICMIRNCSRPAGSFVEVRVTGFKNYDLICEEI